jgi:hypothetical protein
MASGRMDDHGRTSYRRHSAFLTIKGGISCCLILWPVELTQLLLLGYQCMLKSRVLSGKIVFFNFVNIISPFA